MQFSRTLSEDDFLKWLKVNGLSEVDCQIIQGIITSTSDYTIEVMKTYHDTIMFYD